MSRLAAGHDPGPRDWPVAEGTGQRKQHAAAFKAQVALAGLKDGRTVNELAGQFAAHATLIHAWKQQLLAGAKQVFNSGARPRKVWRRVAMGRQCSVQTTASA